MNRMDMRRKVLSYPVNPEILSKRLEARVIAGRGEEADDEAGRPRITVELPDART